MALLESDLQTAIFTWATTMEGQYPELRWLHAIPNGGKRDGREALNLKAQGVKPGILDLALDVARYGYHGFKLELKRPKSKERPTKEQEEYMAFCIEQGYRVDWTNDFEEAKRLIIEYLSMPKTYGSK